MSRRLATHLLELVRLLRSPLVAFAFAMLLTSVWLPLAFEANVPRPLEMGVVQETSSRSAGVVLLDSGVYLSADRISADPGERIQIYDSPWNSPSASPSRIFAWLAVVLIGGLGVLVSSFLFAGAGKYVLGVLEELLSYHSAEVPRVR